jgi:GT2 family glycosyltransferase
MTSFIPQSVALSNSGEPLASLAPSGVPGTEGNQPRVSVIIVYYKRRETIEETLRSVLRQDYPNLEIILVDNHSEDDLRQVAALSRPQVRLIELERNRGACGGRNAGIAAASGEILVFLEDDVTFMSPADVSRIVEIFGKHPQIHVLAFQICDPDSGEMRLREWCHPRHWKQACQTEFETLWFGEGASAFRRTVLEECRGYYEPLFYGAEGDDLVLRLLDRGFRILYTPRVRVGHRASQRGRSLSRQLYYFTRNYIWTAYKDYPALSALRYLIPKLLMMGYFAARTAAYRPFVRGVWDGMAGLKRIHRDRLPVRKSTLRYVNELERTRPGLLARLGRHRDGPQI